jgi:hypothetical protein
MTWDEASVIEAWMPSTGAWSTWVKPLAFAELARGHRGRELPYRERFDLAWVPPTHRERIEKREGSYRDGATVRPVREPVEARAALVIDLPAVRSIDLGMALVAHGHRPVPLFAGGAGAPPHHTIHDVARRIAAGARELASALLPPDAPPAFLLDASRLEDVVPEVYSARAPLFPQDFPGARCLLEHDIDRAILVSTRRTPAEDLRHVLARWQLGGVRIESCPLGSASPRALELEIPSDLGSLTRRALSVWTAVRGVSGGFGGVLPDVQRRRRRP